VQGASAISVSAIRRRHPLRRLYNWVLGFAHKKDSERALFVIALIESSLLPLPLGLFLVTLCLGAVEKSFRFALVCSLGSIIGGMIAYGLGHGAWQIVEPWLVPLFISPEMFAKAERIYAGNAWLAILTSASDADLVSHVGVGCGCVRSELWFVRRRVDHWPAHSLLADGALVHFFGERARHIIERHLGVALLVGAVVVVASYLILKAVD
jgi:membrane protein YqaA with SNARE-associated domain